ncbi:MAG: hypothetical protein U0350_39635 [Caldilineaceae bacterium]
MPFFVIAGTFHIQGYQPDGDSIRFKANNEANWAKLSGPTVALNGRRHAQLRLEAIDTLETHFMNTHQPLALANKATEALLHGLGITGLETDALRTQVTAAVDGTEGYIISRSVEKNHRPVAFVFAGKPPVADGAKFFLDVAHLRKSVNYQQLETGLAYPTYYQGLFPDLRKACTNAVHKARAEHLGLWAEDRTNTGFTVDGLAAITERNVILPKLFRRLVEYLQGGGTVGVFKEYMEARAEAIFIISTAHYTHFDTILEVAGETVRMTEPPENLLFIE